MITLMLQNTNQQTTDLCIFNNAAFLPSCTRPSDVIHPVLYPQHCSVSVEFSTGYWLSGLPTVALPPLEAIYSSLINI